MGLFRFILGVLGILLIIGAFSSFIPLVFLGGIATGNVIFAFGFPIFLIVLGAIMVYFGFYYKISKDKNNYHLIQIVKWGVIYTIAILLSNYIISRLMIVNTFFVILFTAAIVSIVTEIVRSHKYHFNLKWFIFYFLVYTNIIWIMEEFILPQITSQTNIFSSLVIGFGIAGVILIIKKIEIKSNSIKWICFILLIILLVANLESLQFSPITPIIRQSINTSGLSEDKKICPTNMNSLPLIRNGADFNPISVSSALNNLIDTSIWRIEGNIRTCYKGKYKGQYPDWIYCDDMIVSRWGTSSAGTIRYRWYTAITAEWRPEKGLYIFDKFSCEIGKKVSVDKETSSFTIQDSKDGSEINVHVSRDGIVTNIEY